MKILPLEGGGEWPAGCVYCLGRNYMAHAREMGQHEKKPPLVFIKPAHTLTAGPYLLSGRVEEDHGVFSLNVDRLELPAPQPYT